MPLKVEPDQLSIFVDTNRLEHREQIQGTVERLRDCFGKRAVTYAALLGGLKMPDDGRHQVKMLGLMHQ